MTAHKGPTFVTSKGEPLKQSAKKSVPITVTSKAYDDNKTAVYEELNIIMFKKDSNYYYGVVTGILGDQVEILCSDVSYTRPTTAIIQIANSSIPQ